MKRFDAIPMKCRAIEIGDPTRMPAALVDLDHPFALRSDGAGGRARWSFFGAEPFEVFRGGDWAMARARWRQLACAMRRGGEDDRMARAIDAPGGEAGVDVGSRRETMPPFTGGAVGYWAYDFGRRLESLPARARDDLGLPDFVLALYDVVIAFDHATGHATLFSSGLPEQGSAGERRAEARLDDFARRIEGRVRDQATRGEAERVTLRGAPIEACSTFDPGDYRRAVDAVKEHIRRGDLFQANLSQRWTAPLSSEDPARRAATLFDTMMRDAPTPFAAWFAAGDHAIASASPERFLELSGGRVETRPIKGTRPRGSDPAGDARLAAELVGSAKDRAENVMIVDVLRNDLGRVCRTGSVEVEALCELETFPHVFHLTSTVTGRLRERLDAFDLLEACFPGGSITGAPKIRAMEILDALEPVRRHLYTGSLGYVDWSGDADWNILIRTALVTADAVHFAAGGGITADSDPDAEYEETLHKAEAVRGALASIVGPVTLEPSGVSR
jgi:para-aminobenzoate synthetase component I